MAAPINSWHFKAMAYRNLSKLAGTIVGLALCICTSAFGDGLQSLQLACI